LCDFSMATWSLAKMFIRHVATPQTLTPHH
jgi:hypothetical protein